MCDYYKIISDTFTQVNCPAYGSFNPLQVSPF